MHKTNLEIKNRENYRNQKILFTTSCEKIPDYFDRSISRLFRITLPTPSFGLRFLKENIPALNILEYPTWRQFKKAIRQGVDVLGVSFYMKDVPMIKKMIQYARDHGVQEVWGGNYGVLESELKSLFDKTFVGYAEQEIYRTIYGSELTTLRHPLLQTKIGVRWTPFQIKYGFLFTIRGCRYACTFCQTKAFVNQVSLLPLEAVEEVLIRYKQNGVNFVFIMDENALTDKQHARQITDLLHQYGFMWGVMTRLEHLAGRVAEYRQKGMVDCLVGIESINQAHLTQVKKGSHIQFIQKVVEELNQNHIYIHAGYIIGFETDTVQSVRNEIEQLKTLKIDSFQVCVLTPYPQTVLWDELKTKYGLSSNYQDYDAYHLAWNHPAIGYRQMNDLVRWAKKQLYNPKSLGSMVLKLLRNRFLEKWLRHLLTYRQTRLSLEIYRKKLLDKLNINQKIIWRGQRTSSQKY